MIWDWQFAEEIMPQILRGLGVTLQAVVGGAVIAVLLGLLWAIMRRSRRRLIAWPAAAGVEAIRSTPLLVQIYFLFYVMPEIGLTLDPMIAGILALGIHYSCYASEVYRSGIDAVSKGQWEASTALGLSSGQCYRYVILPQAIPPIIPALGNYIIAMLKDAPLLSAITVLGILQRAKIIGNETFRYIEPLTIVGAIFLLLSLISSCFIRLLERRLKVTHA